MSNNIPRLPQFSYNHRQLQQTRTIRGEIYHALLRNVYSEQETAVRTGSGMSDRLAAGKGVRTPTLMIPFYCLYRDRYAKNTDITGRLRKTAAVGGKTSECWRCDTFRRLNAGITGHVLTMGYYWTYYRAGDRQAHHTIIGADKKGQRQQLNTDNVIVVNGKAIEVVGQLGYRRDCVRCPKICC